ncbi:ABC transporter ATP-binding protein [Anaerotignum sp. MSJ-24]|uniref:ABC transporter ATP-binding protein n=1 Tax=Anaerotignum sp. MSJ-24 TaxID=2841521 RepID=UPI001C110969|nr:ABC transporter ATP-binding protein [Anaerotignum sp. MSJ-24]MBU5463543.1 ABC transporter ATP-binding protein/permease [Anaerotignum sp. MSJ-24]
MRKLLIYLKDYKKESVLAPLFKMLEAIFELFVPLVMSAVIDVGIKNSDKPYIIKMCLVLVALGIIGLVCSITAQYFAAKAACGFATKLRHSLFDHIQSLSFSEMDAIGTSTLITRMTSDINQVQNGVNMTLRLFLRSPFVVFGSMIMAFTISIKAAMIFVIAIPLLSLVVFGIMYMSIPLYKNVQSNLDDVLRITHENLTGSRVIRAFHKEDNEIEQFENSNNSLSKLQIYVGKISALMNPITYTIINIAIVALIWTGAIQVNIGNISQGNVVALVNYMSQILVELVKLANLIVLINKAIACGNRVESVFEINSSLIEPEKPAVVGEKLPETVVSFDHVSLKYKNSSQDSLTDITFDVKRGETIGIIGGTGSGKSSLVNMLPRFYDYTGGQLKIDGIDVKDYAVDDLRNKIGVVMQKAVLFKGTIRENLKWGNPDASDADLMEALETAQAAEVVQGKENGLDAEVAQGGKNFSGGQKQRLTIARALVRKPEILILDDSASALDYATDAALRKAIRDMKNSPTVFIVSQRAASILYADKIIVLDDGKMAGIGTHTELLENCPVYQEIYYSQFPKERKEA